MEVERKKGTYNIIDTQILFGDFSSKIDLGLKENLLAQLKSGFKNAFFRPTWISFFIRTLTR
jgi:hypothetical protein